MRQTTIDTIDKTFDEASLFESAQWRILAFDKSGKSHRGECLWESRERAERKIQGFEARMASGKIDGLRTLDGTVYAADYHYSMPMPELP